LARAPNYERFANVVPFPIPTFQSNRGALERTIPHDGDGSVRALKSSLSR